MKLFCDDTSVEKKPLCVVFHGLCASSDNWRFLAPHIHSSFRVLTYDLPNHGKSLHIDSAEYEAVGKVVWDDIVNRNTAQEDVVLLGHSMGGKLAMYLALQHSQAIKALVTVDIAPAQYPAWHRDILKGLHAVQEQKASTIEEADNILQEYEPDVRTRRFLLKNFQTQGSTLRLNIDVLYRDYDKICSFPSMSRTFEGKALCIYGEKSEYINQQKKEQLQEYFPAIEYTEIKGTGHWLHAEKTEDFLLALREFIDTL